MISPTLHETIGSPTPRTIRWQARAFPSGPRGIFEEKGRYGTHVFPRDVASSRPCSRAAARKRAGWQSRSHLPPAPRFVSPRKASRFPCQPDGLLSPQIVYWVRRCVMVGGQMVRSRNQNIRDEWSTERLRNCCRTRYRGESIVVLANREPFRHDRAADGGIVLRRSPGGLVTALEPLIEACSGTWVAH